MMARRIRPVPCMKAGNLPRREREGEGTRTRHMPIPYQKPSLTKRTKLEDFLEIKAILILDPRISFLQ